MCFHLQILLFILSREMNQIYIISDGTNIKIGFSSNPKRRLKQLQTANSNQLQLLYSKPTKNAKKIEKHLHKILWEFRSKYKGEWFTISELDWLFEYINEITLGDY